MSERPIIFSAPMVRALLAGRKTQTRRIVRAAPSSRGWNCDLREGRLTFVAAEGVRYFPAILPYDVGDRLWVREAWRTNKGFDYLAPSGLPGMVAIHYEADGSTEAFGRLRPGMFMPRWASRLTLTVTAVRVERLQDISEADAEAEGIHERPILPHWPERPFASVYRGLWNDLHGPRAWDANPWVAAISFSIERAAP